MMKTVFAALSVAVLAGGIAALPHPAGQHGHGFHGVFGAFLCRAVKPDTGPHKIEIIGGAKINAARSGKAGGRGRQHGERGTEALKLTAIHRRVRSQIVGAGEMAHQQNQIEG